jgi:hypothetical protein
MKELKGIANWLIDNSLIIAGVGCAFGGALANNNVLALVLAGLGCALLVFRPKFGKPL